MTVSSPHVRPDAASRRRSGDHDRSSSKCERCGRSDQDRRYRGPGRSRLSGGRLDAACERTVHASRLFGRTSRAPITCHPYDEPIVLDGALDEAAWREAPVAKGFVQNEPHEGQPATFDTEVRVLHDDKALYFGVFARDDEPSGVIVSELKKDFNTAASDGFLIVIDTFSDQRNGFEFAINPAGAKWDAQMSNEGRESQRELGRHLGCAHADRQRRLVCGDPHSVPDAEVHAIRTRRPGASISSDVCAERARTASGRPCRGSIRWIASRWPARLSGLRRLQPAVTSG